MALLTDGTVLEWGNGVLAPMTVAGLSGVTAVASGGGERLAVLGSGEVMTWGGSEGLVPVGVGEATAVASGPDGGFGLAVLKDGTVKAWGRNNYGQLGDGVTNEGSSEPLAVCAVGTEGACPEGPYLSGVVAIAAGEYHSLALLGNGTVVAWGLGFHGQLGNGPGSPSFGDPTPTPVGGVSGVTAIAASGEHSMALEADGTVTEWGACCAKGYPYLPATVAGLSEVTSIAAGRGHSLALLSNGAVMAWALTNRDNWAMGTISPAALRSL